MQGGKHKFGEEEDINMHNLAAENNVCLQRVKKCKKNGGLRNCVTGQ